MRTNYFCICLLGLVASTVASCNIENLVSACNPFEFFIPSFSVEPCVTVANFIEDKVLCYGTLVGCLVSEAFLAMEYICEFYKDLVCDVDELNCAEIVGTETFPPEVEVCDTLPEVASCAINAVFNQDTGFSACDILENLYTAIDECFPTACRSGDFYLLAVFSCEQAASIGGCGSVCSTILPTSPPVAPSPTKFPTTASPTFLPTSILQLAECEYEYFYVNPGHVAVADNDNEVAIACVDSEDCTSIIYVESGCKGCFDQGCPEGVSRKTLAIPSGGLVTFSAESAFSSGKFSSGDQVCSTGQLSIMSQPSTIVSDGPHPWIPGSLAGTDFIFNKAASTSTSGVELFIYALAEDSTVTITDGGAPLESFLVQALSFNITEPLIAAATDAQPVKIRATAPVLIASATQEVDEFGNYAVVPPVLHGPVYGFSSTVVQGAVFDCSSLESSINQNRIPVCEDSASSAVSPDTTSSVLFFNVIDNSATSYSGSAMVCSPPGDDLCLTSYTAGDGDGIGTTSWTLEPYFGNLYVLPYDAEHLSLISAGTGRVNCSFVSPFGTALDSESTDGTSINVKKVSFVSTFSQGTKIQCDDHVALIAQFTGQEFNIYGQLPGTTWDSNFPALSEECSPSGSPSSSSNLFELGPSLMGMFLGAVLTICAVVGFAKFRQRLNINSAKRPENEVDLTL